MSKRITVQDFDLTASSDADKAVSDTGFMGSYDIVTTAADFNRPGDTSSAGANLGGTLFTPDGIINASGFTQSQTDRAFTRLDTTAEFDQPADMRRWLAGDTATGSLNWSRSVRVAGFQLASDFSMRPDLNTMPLPVFFWQTALPSTVDVYVNAARVFENNVDAGPFQINNLPIMTGSGDVSVVTRDALGQQTVSVLPFYASNQLLKPGLESYAFDLGFIREDYGQRSFSYSEPATTGTYSRGINDWLTVESHGEAVHNLQLGGGGAVFSLGTFGVMHAAMAGSHFDDDTDQKYGSLYSLSLETQQHPFGFFASAAKTLGPYADVASLGSMAVPSLQTQVGGSLGLEKNGSFSLSWIRTDTGASEPAELVSGSYTVSFAQRWNFGLTSFYDITNHASVSEALISFSFDNGTIANSASRLARNNNQQEVDVLKPVNVDGGVGYHVATAVGQPSLAEGDVKNIHTGRYRFRIACANDFPSLWREAGSRCRRCYITHKSPNLHHFTPYKICPQLHTEAGMSTIILNQGCLHCDALDVSFKIARFLMSGSLSGRKFMLLPFTSGSAASLEKTLMICEPINASLRH